MGVAGIKIRNVKKSYEDNMVVNVDELFLEPGMRYSLVGSNGSGKTTLMNIIVGNINADEGAVYSNQSKVEMVHHEDGLFQEMKVYENLFLNRESYYNLGRRRYVNWHKTKQRAEELLKKYGLNVDIHSKIKSLDGATQKLLEIIIALSKDPDVLIVDEPMTYLDVEQMNYVGGLLENFMGQNKTIVYITHRIDKIARNSNRIIVMRDGRVADVMEGTDGSWAAYREFSEKDAHKYPKRPFEPGNVFFEISNLKTEHIQGIDFFLREGEILGIVGLKGSYKEEIGKAIFSAVPHEGKFMLDKRVVKLKSTAQAVDKGICYIGGKQEGIFTEDTIYSNVVSANTRKIRRLKHSARKLISKYYVDMLNVKGGSLEKPVEALSAGNKQKVLLAKWLFSNSKVFIFNKPTSNIDASSKIDIYNIFNDLVESGAGIILISDDLEEVAGLSDRIMVLKNGRIQQWLEGKDKSVYKIIATLQNWD